MGGEAPLLFGPFCLDTTSGCVWQGEKAIKMTPKAFAVLAYLAERPGRLVTKEELFRVVWPKTVVSDTALAVCIREIRLALADTLKPPQFIETVHRRGYRFIAPLTTAQPVQSSKFQVPSAKSKPAPSPQHSAPTLVGRDTELAQLHYWLDRALQGERQIVFVTGEPGIGKTSVVEAFLEHLATKGGVQIGRGQCIEHYGAGEGYMPVLEALGRLCREPGGKHLIMLLNRYAPTWLVQMPALLESADLEALQRKVQGASRERMLREMGEALEVLTAEQPLVLRLEDLHWSDHSTLELLSVLARRRERARLLVIGTYRPMEMLADGHPLRTVKQELQLHRQCEEQRLALLTEEHVAEYLTMRFSAETTGWPSLQGLAQLIHQRTEGNPLFMVNVVDYLAAQGGLGESVEKVQNRVPGDLRQMIEEQIHRLSPEEQNTLEVASVAGAEFSAAAVAAGVEAQVSEVEIRCAGLARREQFLQARGIEEWPDGTVAARYSFLHALYQQVLYERVTAGRRIELHRQIGERQERAYGERAREISAALAVHFERGHDYRRAVQYCEQAGKNAIRRSAYVEAISLLTRGLELLKMLPDTSERIQQELGLQVALGAPLMAVKGYSAPEVEHTYARSRELCQRVEETPQLFVVLCGLYMFYHSRGELWTAYELADQLLHLAQNLQDPGLLLTAHLGLGANLYWRGEFASARAHMEQGLFLYDPQKPPPVFHTADLRVDVLSYAAIALWHLGYPDQALKRSHEAAALAEGLSHPFSLAYALWSTALLHSFRRERELARKRTEALITLSTEQGFPFWLAEGTIHRGWVLAAQGQEEEGVVQIRQGLAGRQAIGAEIGRPSFLALLAEAYGRVGQVEEGLSVVAEALALVDKTGQCVSEAELYRLKGELTLQQESQKAKGKGQKAKVEANPQSLTPDPQAEAEECFLKAIEIARRQQAKSLELRAVMSLSRLWQQQGKKTEAHQMLAEIYGWFTEGFDTRDLQEAKALLEEIS